MGGGRSKPADTVKTNEQPSEKKKGFADWVNFIKPPNEEKDHWVMIYSFTTALTEVCPFNISSICCLW